MIIKKMYKFIYLIILVFILINPAHAELYVSGVMGDIDAGIGDAYGWAGSPVTNVIQYRKIAVGEPFRIMVTLDDDEDEITSAKLDIYLQEYGTLGYGGDRFLIHTFDNVGNGVQYVTIDNLTLPDNRTPGWYYVYVKATVITPGSERGVIEWEYSSAIEILPQKKWNIVTYISGDNSLSAAVYGDLREMSYSTGTSKDVNVFALVDLSGNNNTFLLRLHQTDQPNNFGFRMKSNFLNFGGELKTSDANKVVDLIRWANDKHKADKWTLTLWNHGGGWRMFNEDKIPAPAGFMHLKGLRIALNTINGIIGKKLEVLGFDECLMSMLEVAYEFKDYANTMIASQKTEGNSGWYHTDYVRYLVEHPNTDNAVELARYMARSAATSGDIKTLAAFDLTKINALAQSVGTLADRLRTESKNHTAKFVFAREASKEAGKTYQGYMDLYDYLENLKRYVVPKINSLNGPIADAETKYNDALIYNHATIYHFFGLSIYYPHIIYRQFYKKSTYDDFYPSPELARLDDKNKLFKENSDDTGAWTVDVDLKAYENQNWGAQWGPIFTSAGNPGKKWFDWIITDIVTPDVKEVVLTQKQNNNEVEIYNSTKTPPNQNIAKAGELKIKIVFNESMKQNGIPEISFGKEDPYEDFRFQNDRGWQANTHGDTWYGKFNITNVPELYNGKYKLKIFAYDKKGNKIDIDWSTDDNQPRMSDEFEIKVKGIPYLENIFISEGEKPVYIANWNTQKNGRNLTIAVNDKYYIGDIKGKSTVLLKFSEEMDKDSIKLKIGGKELKVKKGDDDFNYTGEIDPDDLPEIEQGESKELPIIVEGKDKQGNRIDADPQTFPSKNDQGQWTYYEAAKGGGISVGTTGGVDNNHKLVIYNKKIPELSLLILLDGSGSMKDNGKLENSKKAISNILHKLTRDIEIGLIIFYDDQNVAVQEFTTDTSKIISLVNSAQPYSATFLAGTINRGRELFLTSAHPASKEWRVQIFSDGEETCGGDVAGELQKLMDVIKRHNKGIDKKKEEDKKKEKDKEKCTPESWKAYNVSTYSDYDNAYTTKKNIAVKEIEYNERCKSGDCNISLKIRNFKVGMGTTMEGKKNGSWYLLDDGEPEVYTANSSRGEDSLNRLRTRAKTIKQNSIPDNSFTNHIQSLVDTIIKQEELDEKHQ